MSRIGKKIIEIPAKTEVTSLSGVITVKGPLGTLTKTFKPTVAVAVADGKVTLTPTEHTLDTLALWGTYSAHVQSMVNGVNKPFEKKLIVEGIGFKSEVKATDLHLALGFSHPVKVAIPATLKVTAEKNIITISGIDSAIVGEFAASVRAYKKPEPYKGKGIRYSDEVIRRKQGKKSV